MITKLTLALVLAASLTACGGKTKPATPAPTPTGTTTETQTETQGTGGATYGGATYGTNASMKAQ